jgi:hypothetical protein
MQIFDSAHVIRGLVDHSVHLRQSVGPRLLWYWPGGAVHHASSPDVSRRGVSRAWRVADSGGMTGGDVGLGAGHGRRWDATLSFAGAQRDYVGQVAQALKAQGVRCFYDADE